MPEKNVKLTDEVIINLWNEKRTVKGKEMKTKTKFIFPEHGLCNTKDLISYIVGKDCDINTIFPDMFIETLTDEFEDETGKNAVWRGYITKQFLRWLEEYE